MVIGSEERPLRVAIVGAGPSGFYAATALLRSKEHTVCVDLFDRLPTPYGLVRGGVAPDHQKIKGVVRAYDKTAANPRFRFFGNVRLGEDISVEQLLGWYDQVCFTTGCEGSRSLNLPGEELAGSHSATDFVGWYNAHPDHREHDFALSSKAAVVVGVGNVAMDVARILAQSREELHPTDIDLDALGALADSQIEDIYILGRRGPAQAAFSPTELKELAHLPNVALHLPERSHALDPVSAAWLEEEGDKRTRSNVALLQEQAAQGPGDAPVRIHLWLCTSPVEYRGDDGVLNQVEVEVNRLEDGGGRIRPVGTGERHTIDAGLVFRSVGYRGKPIPGVPFDDWKGHIRNQEGRIVDDSEAVVPRMYTAGWAKRGPSGLIGTNRACSVGTVGHMFADMGSIDPAHGHTSEQVSAALSEAVPQHTTWENWQNLNAQEVSKGEAEGRVRTKFSSVDAMMGALS